jgi:predicted CoA-binding protein
MLFEIRKSFMSLQTIQEFLGRKRIAVIGVSRNPKDFTRSLFRELLQRGYDAVPVNPNATEVEGLPCFPRVQDVSPAVEGALLMTKAAASAGVVEQCAEAGVRQIWLYRATGAGAVSEEALQCCAAHDLGVVAGECPFMFLPEAAWPHRVHGFCRKLIGRFPK